MKPRRSLFDENDPDVISVLDDLPLWSAPFGFRLLDAVRMRKDMRVLDVGSGLGFPSVELSQRLGDSCRVYAIDPWRAANRRARHKITVWKLDNLHLIEANAERIPFPDRFFDLVVSNNGTNNVAHETETYGEIVRVSKPGAQVVLTMNLPETMNEFYEVYRRVLREMNKPAELERLEQHIHEKRKPPSHTRTMLERVGLEIVHVHHDSFVLRYNDGSTLLTSPLIRIGFLPPWLNVLAPEDVKAVFDAIEHALNDIAVASGALSLTVPWVCVDARKPG
jgi:ubiquinone/menaquinone biosynthesis C-methylase UbiE